MPRYFFNLTDGGTIRDPDGEEFPDIKSVKAVAAQVASDVAGNTMRPQTAGLHISVTDENGKEVFRTPLAL